MKTKLLLLALLAAFLFPGRSLSQVNTYFDHNPVWKVSSSCAVEYPCIRDEISNYYVNGDSLFGSDIFKKIYFKAQGTNTWMAPPPVFNCTGSYHYTDTFPSFFLRSAGKKMFLRQRYNPTEYLLYDFNLAVGDTLPLSYNNTANAVTVTAIDSIYTPYGYRKRFSLAGNTWSQFLVEGIGHSKGLVQPMQVPFECGYELNCFGLNDTAYYPAMGPTCNIAIGIVSYENDIPSSVSPNPFSDFTLIQFDAPVKNGELNIYDPYGQKVQSIQHVSGKNLKIERGNLKPGIYFYELKLQDKKTSIAKLIVTD